MRSQATKPLPKKGTTGKAAVKANSVTKPPKKKGVSPKKVKNLANKAFIKNAKKTSKDSKDDVPSDKNEGDTSASDKSDASSENIKSGPSKGAASRSNSPTKKQKKDANKDKKEPTKIPQGTKTKKIVKKVNKSKSDDNKSDNEDDVKYKINLDVAKKAPSKFSKAKTIIKKSNVNQKKKALLVKKQEKSLQENEDKNDNKEKDKSEDTKEVSAEDKKQRETNRDTNESQDEKKEDPKPESVSNTSVDAPPSNNPPTNPPTSTQPDTPKVETERPPKFFTSSRSPRVVDIDVKLCKNSKGNLSVSERFVKCDTKTDDSNKDKALTNTLVSQGPEVDVYTFTEKVDSPKSILTDFRSPMNKNIGRVRPIARVKGTIIDKKDPEKKKYSPHRPIEEVVKQLKANKRSEETGNNNLDNATVTSAECAISEKESIENPQPIVSKSYKMVARKSSITGKPFSPSFGLEEDESSESKPETTTSATKKPAGKKKKKKKTSVSDDEFESCKFAFNTKSFHYSSSEESVSESNDDNETKESSSSDNTANKKRKNKKYKRITDSAKKNTSKELRELSKDSLIDLKDEALILGGDKPSKRRLKLLSMWTGPKKHRMASLNAIAKVHCLYENESRTHMELGLMRTVDRQVAPSTSKAPVAKKKEPKPKEKEEKQDSTSESEYENIKKDKKEDSSESSDDNPPQRSLRGDPGIRSAGKYWDPKSCTSSSEDSELESKKKVSTPEKKKAVTKSPAKSDSEKPPAKMKKTAGVPVKKKRNRNEVVMDLKDMVVQKRMASLNATAILAASYEKRSPKSSKEDTTSDSCSDESFSQKSKNVIVSGVKSEIKHEDTKKEIEDAVMSDSKQKVEVIVNQESDVTITGVYSTHHHEGFCTVSGMQYRISSTSHTQTTATANCEKEGCARDEARYTPLTALSSMQPPEGHVHGHPHPVPELGGLARRAAGCSSAFSAPSPSAHHDPGYYQPAGPMIKETGADAERALARYHPPHYHAPHPPVLQQYGGPYYPADLCYGRYYRPPGPPYHMPPQPDAQMVGVGSESYSPQYYGSPPCYQHSHSPQRIPYVEYRGCPCPLNACPKNVLIGPATGKAPTGAGPDVLSALAPPGGAFRPKARACVLDVVTDTHGSGKDPPLEQEPPAAADAPHPCPLPAIGGASPKREIYDVRDKIRLVGDIPGPAEALGPPSPARGSAGACAPQPPPVAPRRARLGKEAARKSLADTGQLLSTPQQPQPAHSSDPDDDVMAFSPPTCAPIDLSSSDERSTPLVDVKKENEGPTCTTPRKPEAQALKEQNTTSVQETVAESTEPKAVKRRYSRPKLEIDMKDTQLEESLKTNGIGEHVKLQKRRKVSGDLTTIARVETVTKETKRKAQQSRKTPRTPNSEKKPVKRKIDNASASPKAKKMLLESSKKTVESAKDDDSRVKDLSVKDDDSRVIDQSGAENLDLKPKTKSAIVLDNLIRKNSVDRPADDKKIDPADLFLSPDEQCSSKKININNNIVENSSPVCTGVRSKTIAAVTQLIQKKLLKVDSKVTNNMKPVLKTPTDKLKYENPVLFSGKCKAKREKNDLSAESSDSKAIDIGKVKCDDVKDNLKESVSVSNSSAAEDGSKSAKVSKAAKPKAGNKNETITNVAEESHSTLNKTTETLDDKTTDPLNEVAQDKSVDVSKADKNKRSKLTSAKIGQMKNKSIETVAKLLSKKPATAAGDNDLTAEQSNEKEIEVSPVSTVADTTAEIAQPKPKTNEIKTLTAEKVAKTPTDPTTTEEQKEKRLEPEPERIPEKILPKRCKLTNGELKEEKKKKVEKVVKLLVSKKPAIKTDEATLLVEEACASPVPCVGRRARRRRSGGVGGAGGRRARRPLSLLPPPAAEPRAPPRWSNGWHWDGEPYPSKVYVNNDSRLIRTVRCWQRMNHQSGDSVSRGDTVLLKASTGKQQQPFVAKVASLWENPEDGEMMVSLVWYYRPEHTERGREPADSPDEVFASRHRDANSVACIEDRCYVLTFNEYCRYRKRLKAAEEGVTIIPTIVPPLPAQDVTPAVQPNDTKVPPGVSPELVLFCRKIYDFRSKKLQVPNK